VNLAQGGQPIAPANQGAAATLSTGGAASQPSGTGMTIGAPDQTSSRKKEQEQVTPIPPEAVQAVEAAKAALVNMLDLSDQQASHIGVVRVEAVEWPDTSLGLPEPDKAYALVVTPGWRITLRYQGKFYVYHTNQDGSVVKLASETSHDPGRMPSRSSRDKDSRTPPPNEREVGIPPIPELRGDQPTGGGIGAEPTPTPTPTSTLTPPPPPEKPDVGVKPIPAETLPPREPEGPDLPR
jgi:hypothetical protein